MINIDTHEKSKIDILSTLLCLCLSVSGCLVQLVFISVVGFLGYFSFVVFFLAYFALFWLFPDLFWKSCFPGVFPCVLLPVVFPRFVITCTALSVSTCALSCDCLCPCQSVLCPCCILLCPCGLPVPWFVSVFFPLDSFVWLFLGLLVYVWLIKAHLLLKTPPFVSTFMSSLNSHVTV